MCWSLHFVVEPLASLCPDISGRRPFSLLLKRRKVNCPLNKRTCCLDALSRGFHLLLWPRKCRGFGHVSRTLISHRRAESRRLRGGLTREGGVCVCVCFQLENRSARQPLPKRCNAQTGWLVARGAVSGQYTLPITHHGFALRISIQDTCRTCY